MEKELIRERMREAMRFRQKEKLDECITHFEQAGLQERDGDLKTAKRMLEMLAARESKQVSCASFVSFMAALYLLPELPYLWLSTFTVCLLL